MRWPVLLSLPVSLGLALATAGLLPGQEQKAKSGTAPGNYLPGPFQPYNLTGEHKGKHHCLVCEFGLNPTAVT